LEGEGGQLSGETLNPQNVSTSTLTTIVDGLIINQNNVGNILQLQSAGQDRFLVATSGSVMILANSQNDTEELFSISNTTTSVFAINVRGDSRMKGIIVLENDSVAGSIATDAITGLAEVNFNYHLGTGKPVVQLTPEGDIPVVAQVTSWKKDSVGNYVGFFLKTFGLSGQAVSANVHYAVFGKPAGYSTAGDALPILTNTENDPAPIVSEPTATSTEPTATSTPVIDGDTDEISSATTTSEVIEESATTTEPVIEETETGSGVATGTASSTDNKSN
jgi:hypothetical protein